jgi:hypothetical protein
MMGEGSSWVTCDRLEARMGWHSRNEDVVFHDEILAGTRP